MTQNYVQNIIFKNHLVESLTEDRNREQIIKNK